MTELPWDASESAYEVRSRSSCPCGCQDGETRAADSPMDYARILAEYARRLGVTGVQHSIDTGEL